MTTPYTNVQFIGYAIPSIPRMIADIGSAGAPGFVEGRYTGINPAAADIDARIALTMNAVDCTLKSGAVDPSATTLKIFLMPEFSFRGKQGTYEVDLFDHFRNEFSKRVAAPDYEGWLFVAGTIVNTTQDYVRGQNPRRDLKARIREDLMIALTNTWQHARANQEPSLTQFAFNTLAAYTDYCHTDPVYEVTDKSYVVAGGAPDATYPQGLTVQKKFVSGEDFVLNLFTNAHDFTEAEAAYPPIPENQGEDKQTAFDDFSIFTIKGIKFGLEVCLDHAFARLRRNRLPATELVQIHLVPSCGMQIVQSSVVAGAGGLVFNCDGQYDGLMPTSQPGPGDSVWTGTASHRAHSQLTQVVTPCEGPHRSMHPAVLTMPGASVTTVPIEDASASELFAYGAGEVHVYTPLPVPPPVAE